MATVVSKNWDTTGTSVFAICKTFPSRIPGLITGLPDIPTACSPGCTGRRQQVCNYNTSACNSELFSTSCCHWSTACPGLFEHRSISSQLCPATHPCIPSCAACFLLLTARCWPWQSSQVLWKIPSLLLTSYYMFREVFSFKFFEKFKKGLFPFFFFFFPSAELFLNIAVFTTYFPNFF